jgi:hypothetical protein
VVNSPHFSDVAAKVTESVGPPARMAAGFRESSGPYPRRVLRLHSER